MVVHLLKISMESSKVTSHKCDSVISVESRCPVWISSDMLRTASESLSIPPKTQKHLRSLSFIRLWRVQVQHQSTIQRLQVSIRGNRVWLPQNLLFVWAPEMRTKGQSKVKAFRNGNKKANRSDVQSVVHKRTVQLQTWIAWQEAQLIHIFRRL